MDIRKVNPDTFVFTNYPTSYVNGLRRILLTELPHIAFDPDPNSINTVVSHNSGILYNELIINRLALVPLNHIVPCTIKSTWNTSKHIREYSFKYPDLVPIYTLDVINSEVTALISNDLSRYVTTDDFNYLGSIEQNNAFEKLNLPKESVNSIFALDKITNDPCLCTILQPSLSSIESIEKQRLAVQVQPIIGSGRDHSCFVQVGTTFMEFVQDPEMQEEAFLEKIRLVNLEMTAKGRKPLSENGIKSQKEEFKTIDSQRVYKKNKYGEPNEIQLTIECINDTSPDQLLFDASEWLRLSLLDLKHELKKKENVPNMTFSLYPNMLRSINVVFNNQGHTVGNLLNSVLQNIFVDNRTRDSPLGKCIQFVSYRVPHPLYQKMELRIQFSQNVELQSIYEQLVSKHSDSNGGNFSIIGLGKLVLQECISYIDTQYISALQSALTASNSSFTTQ